MSNDPTLRALARINPVRPDEVAGQRTAGWARAERDRILAVDRTTGLDGGTTRRPISRRVSGGLITVGALAGIAALSVAVWVGGEDEAPPAPTGATARFGVLERPRTAGDALPAWTRGHRNLGYAKVVASTSRRAAVVDGRSLYVTRTTAGGVCLIDAVPKASSGTRNPGGINCQPRTVVADSFLVSKLSGGARKITAVGVVPDGFTQVVSGATTVGVTNNVFLLPGIRPSDPVVAEGPTGRRVETLDSFGNHWPETGGRLLPVAALETRSAPG